MRLRKKRNLAPRLERCAHLLAETPESAPASWREAAAGFKEVHLELGCGKGRFVTELAAQNPDIFYVALERLSNIIVTAAERAEEAGLSNVRFYIMDARHLPLLFGSGEASRIYINFCDPWPKDRDAKHRLTSPRFLALYTGLLAPGGEIHFKTDNRPLFEYSLEQFQAAGFDLSGVNRDLHGGGLTGIATDYELKFHEQGVKICRCVAKLREG